jgi:hypothetical protein
MAVAHLTNRRLKRIQKQIQILMVFFEMIIQILIIHDIFNARADKVIASVRRVGFACYDIFRAEIAVARPGLTL